MLSRWNSTKEGTFSQRVLDRIKPDRPVKSKIETAQSQLGLRISKLDSIHKKLRQKNEATFRMIVEAQKTNNTSYARAYAAELSERKKITDMIENAKLAMEQIQIRLNTVSELGDAVVTLSPCMSVINDVRAAVGGMVPDANASMQDLSEMLGGFLSDSAVNGSVPVAGPADPSPNSETLAILEEAQALVEGRAKERLPDLPDGLKDDIIRRREAYI